MAITAFAGVLITIIYAMRVAWNFNYWFFAGSILGFSTGALYFIISHIYVEDYYLINNIIQRRDIHNVPFTHLMIRNMFYVLLIPTCICLFFVPNPWTMYDFYPMKEIPCPNITDPDFFSTKYNFHGEGYSVN